MKKTVLKVIENTRLAPGVYRMVLEGDASGVWPGQFIDIHLPGNYLRRPISVCDFDEKSITVIYKVVGEGTAKMARIPFGMKLDVLTGLGNGYNLSLGGDYPLLIGGGVGIPPLYALAKRLAERGKFVNVILGFNTKEEMFYVREFETICEGVTVTTADGSYGIKGFVTDALAEGYSYVYSCGPLPMLKAVAKAMTTDGQFSLEERMGCGFGACMGCSIMTVTGAKRVCKDGPVFLKEDIIWED